VSAIAWLDYPRIGRCAASHGEKSCAGRNALIRNRIGGIQYGVHELRCSIATLSSINGIGLLKK
jgi:hypothetical protein